MLSVGKRDGREELGFGADMEELEEGEACSYRDAFPNVDVDPDVAFAYIDDKLHSVLGHFQKDFEGGVSAENLGAKFGGYGSFLPTYQRSPIGSHPRTPKTQNHALRSPSNLQYEGGFQSVTTTDVAPLPVHCRDTSGTRALSTTKLPTHDPGKLDAGVQHCQPKKLVSRAETFKNSSLTDQKKLKVRIRVGSDNLSAQTKAEIYSGLGLHASPSSSIEDSPQSEGWSLELHDAPAESPNSILHMMTSFPLEGSMLLSPLPEGLSYLTGNKKTRKGRIPDSISKSETAKAVSLAVRPGSSTNNGKLSMSKNNMYSKVNGISSELSNRSTGDAHDTISKRSKETHDDTSGCEELISNALRLPLLSTGEIPVSNGKEAGVFRGTSRSEVSKMEPSDTDHHRDDDWADKIYLNQKENIAGEFEARPRKYLLSKDAVESTGTELNPSMEVKASKQETFNNPTSKTNTKVIQKLGGISVAKDIDYSKVKSKSKMSTCDTNTAEVTRAQARDGSSSQSKIVKNINQSSKNELKTSKLQSDVLKSRDTYKELFGDLISEYDENEEEPLEFPSTHVMKDSNSTIVGKMASWNSLKVKATSKKLEKPIKFESHSKNESHVVPGVSDQMHLAPEVIEEDWVCCDSCQKWRLLPAGKLPNSLPKKWLCSMLDWLPGMNMNRCEIDEDETTKALISFYQASAVPGGDKNPHCKIRGNATGELSASIQHPNFRVNTTANSSKKKNGFTEASTTISSHGPARVGDLATNLQPEVKSRSWNNAKRSPSATDMKNSYLKEPIDMMVEKTKKSSKAKHKLLEHSMHGGNAGVIKTNKKRGSDHGSPRPSKKYKNEISADDGWISDMDLHAASMNGGLNVSSVIPLVAASRDHSKSTETKSHIYPDTTLTSSMRTKHRGSSEKRQSDGRGSSGEKRKADGSQESRHSESLQTSGIKREGKNESSQRHHDKVKKARVSNQDMGVSGPKRESTREQSGRVVAKNLKPGKDPDNSLFKQSMEEMGSSRRDLTSSHLVMEATSSSSKISGSRKSKANLQVTEGSPVESVSSSPLRSRKKDRRASNDRNYFDKDCPPDFSGFSGSPKRYSEQEINGENGDVVFVDKDSSSMGKSSGFAHKGTEFSSVLDFRVSVSGGIIKGNPATYDELQGSQPVNKVVNTLDHRTCEHPFSGNGLREEVNNNTFSNGPLRDKKGSSVRTVDRLQKSSFFDSSQDGNHSCKDKVTDDRLSKPTAAESLKQEKKHDVKVPGENCRKDTQVKPSGDGGQDLKHHIFPSIYDCKKISVQEHEGISSTLLPQKMELFETSSLRGKSVLQSPIIGGISTDMSHTHHTLGTGKGNEKENRNGYTSDQDDYLKGPNPERKAYNENGGQPTTSKHSTLVGYKVKDINAPSPVRRDSSQSATSAIKEAKTLKHMADRVKTSGSNADSIGLYFQASLKFLLGASLLESSTSDTKHGEMIQSTQMYSSTANLCKFCANEYEKAKDMASAALAYKCTEVAYMRVIYSSHNNANKYRHELAQDVSFAMDASRKSRVALAAVSAHLEQIHNEEGIASIKRALDFSFQDVEGLLRLIRLAMEAISR